MGFSQALFINGAAGSCTFTLSLGGTQKQMRIFGAVIIRMTVSSSWGNEIVFSAKLALWIFNLLVHGDGVVVCGISVFS